MPRVPTPRKRDSETPKAHAALCDYARMGAGRSLADLHRTYTKLTPEEKPPTRHLRWLKEWSTKYNWQERVAEYDAAMQAAADEEAEREMLTGLALPRERVRMLKGVVQALTADEVREVILLDSRMLGQLRGLLDDLAKETGGRVARSHATVEEYDPADYSEEENRQIAGGKSPAEVRSNRRAE